MIEYHKRTFSKNVQEEVPTKIEERQINSPKALISYSQEKTLITYANFVFWLTVALCAIVTIGSLFTAKMVFLYCLLGSIPTILLALIPRAAIIVFASMSVTLKQIKEKVDSLQNNNYDGSAQN